MLSAKIRYEMKNGQNLIGFESGGNLADILDLIKLEMQYDAGVTIRAAYIVETIDNLGNVTKYAAR